MTEKPKHRGTIIIDSCTLIDLSADIAISSRSHRVGSGRLLEILPVLAKNGYKILIPESVIYETTHHVVIGAKFVSKDALFPKSTSHKKMMARIKEHSKVFLPLFENMLKGKIPNIEIISSDHIEGDAADHMRAIKKTLGSLTFKSKKREAIRQLTEKHLNDFADRIIDRQVDEISARNPDTPTIVLSMDRGLLTRVNDHHHNNKHVHLLDMPGFFQALGNAGILPQIGIKPEITSQNILAMINETLRYHEGNSTPNGYVDSSCEKGKNHKETTPWYKNDHPFAAAMKDLASDLEAEESRRKRDSSKELAPNGTSREGRILQDVTRHPGTPYTEEVQLWPTPSRVERFRERAAKQTQPRDTGR